MSVRVGVRSIYREAIPNRDIFSGNNFKVDVSCNCYLVWLCELH